MSGVRTERSEPVSYTHLDVYKRQGGFIYSVKFSGTFVDENVQKAIGNV